MYVFKTQSPVNCKFLKLKIDHTSGLNAINWDFDLRGKCKIFQVIYDIGYDLIFPPIASGGVNVV